MKALDHNTHVLELSHGPTLAFKDIALKLLPRLVALAAERTRKPGRSAFWWPSGTPRGLEGFKDVPGTSCTVFYPYCGVSAIQALQMTTQGNNTMCWGCGAL